MSDVCQCGHDFWWHADGQQCFRPGDDGCTAYAAPVGSGEREATNMRLRHISLQEEGFTPECTIEVRQVSVTDTIENVLTEHDHLRSNGPGTGWYCRGCGQKMTWWPKPEDCRGHESAMEVLLRKHQAAVIAQRLEAK